MAGTPTIEQRALSDDGRNTSRERPSGLEGFAQRILSELATPARSGSPRGRKEAKRIVSDRSTSVPFDTPLRPPPQTVRSFSPGAPSPSNMPTPAPWDTSKPDAFSSQAKAFQAVDQSILARRVGIPDVKPASMAEKSGDPITLSFDRQRTAGGVSSADEKLAADEEEAKAEEGGGEDALLAPSEDGEPTDDEVGAEGSEPGTPTVDKSVSVSHVLTNVIVLQAFLFELASVAQVRAGLFDEVRFA
jgi:hypothetical protein